MSHRNVLFLAKPIIPQRIQGIKRLAGKCGWNLRLEMVAAPPKDWRGDGVLLMMDDFPATWRFIRDCLKRRIPVVGLDEDYEELDVPRVTGDDDAIGRLAAEHFNERHFRHAAFFSDSDDPHCHPSRANGFRQAWQGESFASWLWTEHAPAKAREDGEALQAWLVQKLRAAPKPLAVFAWNDSDAVHILNACRAAELDVPGDVAILGVDNDPLICDTQSVRLSSVAHDLKRIGYVGAALLERMMSGQEAPRHITRVKPHGIVMRASTDTVVSDNTAFNAVIPYIEGHLAQPLGLTEIANALHLSRNALARFFSSTFGHSVGAEVSARRIAHAQELLETTDLPIESISEQCGYCNRSFFSKCFKSATGTTPLAWRKRKHA